MKKFLSLVLALIMTMSLVTVSAGATEYRDLTDKDEIQYEEAVAVLNRIGVITGYDDGSFRPETELTRGAAAKIIVSLLIGPEAASNLPNQSAPYPDVPASHTFAGVISFCKTAEIISGYGDGTFKPGNSLTGYAFAKMLLGALGYKSEIEGFVDTGWTMNVARVGNVAGLFDRLQFDGSKSVTREEACQLALNTLKATKVTYGGTTLVNSANQAYVVQGTQAMYVTSNNREINANINRRVISAQNNEMTLEFGEEHFKDLRLEHDKYDPAYDDYGHPSNEWSYKKVTIGTFPLPADFTFTKQMSHLEDTTATKEKALGLRGYDTWSVDHRANYGNWSSASTGTTTASPFNDATQIHINGWHARVNETSGQLYTWEAGNVPRNLNTAPADCPTISEIADLTDTGVTVEVYVCPVDADFITDVVVTRTQLMEVRRVASDYVSLDQVDSDSKGKSLTEITGYNDQAIDDDNNGNIIDVKDSNYDAYNVLKDLKAGDRVAVIPYTADNGRTWEAGEVYVPEEVTGTLTKSTGYSTSALPKGNAITVTVGGTEYPIAQWNKDLREIDANLIKATRKDVTLLLDKMGNALLAKDTGNADDWMIVCDYYQAAASNGGKVVWYAHGKTLDGKEDIDVNLGTIRDEAELYAPGSIVHYDIASRNNGEYQLDRRPDQAEAEGAYEVAGWYMDGGTMQRYNITSKNQLVPLVDLDIKEKDGSYIYGRVNVTGTDPDVKDPINFTYQPAVYSKVKFIFVDFDSKGEVDTFIVKDGPVDVDWEELRTLNNVWKNIGTNDQTADVSYRAEAHVNNKGEVDAVVIKTDNGEASLSNIILTTDTTRDEEVDSNGVKWHGRKITRGSDSFKSEDTVMLDKFTEVGEFSRVVKETEDGGAKKLEIKAIGGNFENDALEPIKVTGIDFVQNNNGSKNTKLGFRVGQTNGYKVYDLEGNTLTADPSSAGKIHADFMTNETTMGDSVLSVTNIEGLIRVNSSTKILDLRRVQDDRIDDLEELVDHEKYDLSKTKLSILFNADSGSDGFRYAYLIAVTEAVELKPHPVDLTVTSQTGKLVLDDDYTASNTLVLTANFSKLSDGKALKDTDVSYSWSIDGKSAGGNSKTLSLPVGLTAGNHIVKVTVTPLAKETSPSSVEVTVTVNATSGTTGETVATVNSSLSENSETKGGISAKFNSDIATGKLQMQAEVTAPDWAFTGAGETTYGTLTYTVTLDDKAPVTKTADIVAKGQTNGIPAIETNGSAFKGVVTVTSAASGSLFGDDGVVTEAEVKAASKIAIEITDITWKYAKVEYAFADESIEAANVVTSGAISHLEVGEEGTLSFTVSAPAGWLTSSATFSTTGLAADLTDEDASSPVSETVTAAGDTKVVVTIDDLTEDPNTAAHAITVDASLTGKLLFAKVASDSTITADTAISQIDSGDWKADTINASKDEKVFVKLASSLGAFTGSGVTYATATPTPGAATYSTDNKVFTFTMVAGPVKIATAPNTAPVIKEAYRAPGGSEINVLMEDAVTGIAKEALIELLVESGKISGLELVKEGDIILGVTYQGRETLKGKITFGDTLPYGEINGEMVVGTASEKLGDLLTMAEVAAPADNFHYMMKTAEANEDVTFINAAGLSGDTPAGDVYSTGEGVFYAKLGTPTFTNVKLGASSTIAVAASNSGTIEDSSNDKYVLIGGTVVLTVTNGTAVAEGDNATGVEFEDATSTGASVTITADPVPAGAIAKDATFDVSAKIEESVTADVVIKVTDDAITA